MQPNNTRRDVLRGICFCLCALVLFFVASRVFIRKELTGAWDMTHKIHGFYNEPEDSYDVMCFGSSHMYASFNPVVAWQETGITSYVFATREQPLWLTYYYMKEALRTQSPKVVVLDVRMVIQTDEYATQAVNHAALDDLRFSADKLRAIWTSAAPGDRLPLVVPFVQYHSRWSELEPYDFQWDYLDERDPFKGYVMLEGVNPFTWNDTAGSCDKNWEYLERILDLTQEHGVQLVLYKSPCHAMEGESACFAQVEALAQERGLLFWNDNGREQELGLTDEQHFYDRGHVNWQGAEILTRDLAQRLVQQFALTDYRSHAAVAAQWADSVQDYQASKET